MNKIILSLCTVVALSACTMPWSGPLSFDQVYEKSTQANFDKIEQFLDVFAYFSPEGVGTYRYRAAADVAGGFSGEIFADATTQTKNMLNTMADMNIRGNINTPGGSLQIEKLAMQYIQKQAFGQYYKLSALSMTGGLAATIPMDEVNKYMNKWISTSLWDDPATAEDMAFVKRLTSMSMQDLRDITVRNPTYTLVKDMWVVNGMYTYEVVSSTGAMNAMYTELLGTGAIAKGLIQEISKTTTRGILSIGVDDLAETMFSGTTTMSGVEIPMQMKMLKNEIYMDITIPQEGQNGRVKMQALRSADGKWDINTEIDNGMNTRVGMRGTLDIDRGTLRGMSGTVGTLSGSTFVDGATMVYTRAENGDFAGKILPMSQSGSGSMSWSGNVSTADKKFSLVVGDTATNASMYYAKTGKNFVGKVTVDGKDMLDMSGSIDDKTLQNLSLKINEDTSGTLISLNLSQSGTWAAGPLVVSSEGTELARIDMAVYTDAKNIKLRIDMPLPGVDLAADANQKIHAELDAFYDFVEKKVDAIVAPTEYIPLSQISGTTSTLDDTGYTPEMSI